MLNTGLSYFVAHKWEFFRFSIVGVVTLALFFFLMWLIYGVAGIDYRIAVTAAYALTVMAHFLLNRSFTYGLEGTPRLPSAIRYGSMLFLNYIITFSITTATVELMNLSPYYGVIFSVFGTSISSFCLMKHFVFIDEEQV